MCIIFSLIFIVYGYEYKKYFKFISLNYFYNISIVIAQKNNISPKDDYYCFMQIPIVSYLLTRH